MNILKFRSVAVLSAAAILGLGTSPAISDDDDNYYGSQFGYYYFNDGQGNCGYVSCGEYGCSVVQRFPCPREISGE